MIKRAHIRDCIATLYCNRDALEKVDRWIIIIIIIIYYSVWDIISCLCVLYSVSSLYEVCCIHGIEMCKVFGDYCVTFFGEILHTDMLLNKLLFHKQWWTGSVLVLSLKTSPPLVLLLSKNRTIVKVSRPKNAVRRADTILVLYSYHKSSQLMVRVCNLTDANWLHELSAGIWLTLVSHWCQPITVFVQVMPWLQLWFDYDPTMMCAYNSKQAKNEHVSFCIVVVS